MISNSKSKGFSLIEVIISMAIFLIIIGVSVDIFISIIQQQKRILKEQELVNQTSYAEELMSRAMRMAVKASNTSCLTTIGNIYELTHCTSLPCSGIKFINGSDNNACQEFYLDTTNPANPLLQSKKVGSLAQNILSSQLSIKYLRFIINGDKTKTSASFNDLSQPRVTTLMDVKSSDQQEKIIQTTVSQRNLNN